MRLAYRTRITLITTQSSIPLPRAQREPAAFQFIPEMNTQVTLSHSRGYYTTFPRGTLCIV